MYLKLRLLKTNRQLLYFPCTWTQNNFSMLFPPTSRLSSRAVMHSVSAPMLVADTRSARKALLAQSLR